MRTLITGASGFVGSILVDALANEGVELVLLGRDVGQLTARFPDHSSFAYDDIGQAMDGVDLVVHLAVLNNNADASPTEFHAVNVDMALMIATAAAAAGVSRFLNISSVHALDEGNTTPYAESKRTAAQHLTLIAGIDVKTLYLPLVWGQRWGGRTAALNKLPRSAARTLFAVLAALKPTVHVDHLVRVIVDEEALPPEEPRILTDGQSDNLVYTTATRTIDLGFSLAVVLLLWWLLAVLWLIVQLESRGPGLFVQDRIGRNGRPFRCWKLRTMKRETQITGTHNVDKGSVTKVGAFLRRTKLDELPQVWNLIMGDMSLIGPRPCLPVQETLIAERRVRGVFAVRPGISGLAQVQGVDMSEPVRLARLDAQYVALRGLAEDLKLILRTARGQGGGDRVRTREGDA